MERTSLPISLTYFVNQLDIEDFTFDLLKFLVTRKHNETHKNENTTKVKLCATACG